MPDGHQGLEYLGLTRAYINKLDHWPVGSVFTRGVPAFFALVLTLPNSHLPSTHIP